MRVLVISIILTWCGFTGCSAHNPNIDSELRKLAMAPPIQIESITEKELTVPSPHQITVLEFLAEHCTSCERMSADLDRLARNSSFGQVQFIGVVTGAEVSVANKLRKKEKISFDWISDPDGNIARDYAINGVPTVLVIDEAGQIIMIADGSPGDAKRIANILRNRMPS